jgi:hypothetical protein
MLGSSHDPLSVIWSCQNMIGSALFWAQNFFCLCATIRGSTADAVLFEFGPSRRRDPAMRHHLRRWQPQFRSLFVMRIESFKYRLRVSGYELPEVGRTAQYAYDDRFAAVLGALLHTPSAVFRLGGAQSLHTNSRDEALGLPACRGIGKHCASHAADYCLRNSRNQYNGSRRWK